jgi:hypothetical protein
MVSSISPGFYSVRSILIFCLASSIGEIMQIISCSSLGFSLIRSANLWSKYSSNFSAWPGGIAYLLIKYKLKKKKTKSCLLRHACSSPKKVTSPQYASRNWQISYNLSNNTFGWLTFQNKAMEQRSHSFLVIPWAPGTCRCPIYWFYLN